MSENINVLNILLCHSCGKIPTLKIKFPEGTGNEINISYTCHESDKVIPINDFLKKFKQKIIEKGNKCFECFDVKKDNGLSCPFCFNYFCGDDKLYHLITSKHKDPLKCQDKDENGNIVPRNYYCIYCAERICEECKKEHEKNKHKVIDPTPPQEIKPLKRLLSRYLKELKDVGTYIKTHYNTHPKYSSFEKCHNDLITLIDCFLNLLIFFNNKDIYRPECYENAKNINIEIIGQDLINDNNIDDYLNNFNERIKNVDKYTTINQITPENILIIPYVNEEDNKSNDDINVILKDYHIYDISHRDFIRAVRIFKSKKIVSISDDQTISIWDGNDEKYRHLQTIEFVHVNLIMDLCLYDEGNVEKIITCSNDQCIKIHKFNKSTNQFEWEETIPDAHDDDINKVICLSNGIIISGSDDKTIRIWKNNGEFYKCINILHQNLIIENKKNNENENKNEINSVPYYNQVQNIFFCKYRDQYILFSSGIYGSRKWIFKNIENDLEKKFGDSQKDYFDMENVQCTLGDTIQKLDEDCVIFGGGYDNEMIIVSLENTSDNAYEIYRFKNPFTCKGILVLDDIFLVVGTNNKILRYRKDNFVCLNPINENDNDNENEDKNAHQRDIYGLTEINNKTIISYSEDRRMKIWEFFKI